MYREVVLLDHGSEIQAQLIIVIKDHCYSYYCVIVLSGVGVAESICVDQFAHISLSLFSDSCCGVLTRQLMARLIHSQSGDLPHTTQPIYRLLWWVFEVWVLFNNFMRRIGLQELTVGELTDV